MEQWHPLPTHIGTQGQESTIDYTDRYVINIRNRSLLMSVSFQWGEQRCTPLPACPHPRFALHCPCLKVRRTISDDNSHISLLCHWQFYHQLRLRWAKSPPLTSGFSSSGIHIWLCLHLLWVSSVISKGRGGERFMCFEELPVEVNVFGGRRRKEYADLMWVWGKFAVRRYEPLKMWGWLLFDPQTKWQSEVKKEKKTSFLQCVWPNQ